MWKIQSTDYRQWDVSTEKKSEKNRVEILQKLEDVVEALTAVKWEKNTPKLQHKGSIPSPGKPFSFG